MIIPVRMLAYNDSGTIRNVDIPDDEARNASEESMLHLIYKYGQNDFQRQKIGSVSIGDVIDFNGKHFIVRPMGFGVLTDAELAEYEKLPRRDRSWSAYARPLTD